MGDLLHWEECIRLPSVQSVSRRIKEQPLLTRAQGGILFKWHSLLGERADSQEIRPSVHCKKPAQLRKMMQQQLVAGLWLLGSQWTTSKVQLASSLSFLLSCGWDKLSGLLSTAGQKQTWVGLKWLGATFNPCPLAWLRHRLALNSKQDRTWPLFFKVGHAVYSIWNIGHVHTHISQLWGNTGTQKVFLKFKWLQKIVEIIALVYGSIWDIKNPLLETDVQVIKCRVTWQQEQQRLPAPHKGLCYISWINITWQGGTRHMWVHRCFV